MSAPAGFASSWRMIGALRLHALVSSADGDARPALVMLPGLVTASRSMVPLARAFVHRGFRPWLLDPPGFGYSDKPTRALTMAEQADIAAEWLVAQGLAPALVLGNSFGSQVAAQLASSHPQAVRRVVLLSPTVGPRARRRLGWLRLLPEPRGTRDRSTGHRRIGLLTVLHERLGEHPPLRVLNVCEYPLAGFPRAASMIRCAVLERLESALPSIRAPTLLLRGERDRLSTSAWAGQLAALPRDARLIVLPGLGHDVFYSQPETVAAAATPFLLGARPSAR